MKIQFKELTLRNFLSYGNNTTKINLDFSKPKLVVGRNYDSAVNGLVDSNGAGKSTIRAGIIACLYDKSDVGIEKNEMINYTNGKNMEISITFSVGKINYKIERYRKNKALGGDGVRIYVNPDSEEFDSSHDKTPDSIANANKEIERILGMPYEIFSRIIVFSATNEPFLSLPSSHASKVNQRDIIEELFGLTELTRKAEQLKEYISDNKKNIENIKKLNQRIAEEHDRYLGQLNSSMTKKNEWDLDQKSKISSLKATIKLLLAVDTNLIKNILNNIDTLKLQKRDNDHKLNLLEMQYTNKKDINIKHGKWDEDYKKKIESINNSLNHLKLIDVDYLKSVKESLIKTTHEYNDVVREVNFLNQQKNSLETKLNAINSEIIDLSNATCPYCKQSFHESELKIAECTNLINDTTSELNDITESYNTLVKKLDKLSNKLQLLNEVEIPEDLDSIENSIIQLEAELASVHNSTNPFTVENLSQLELDIDSLELNSVSLASEISALEKQLKHIPNADTSEWSLTSLNKIESSLENYADMLEELKSQSNPFTSVVDELQHTIDVELEKVDNELLDKLDNDLVHQEFLLKLLTKKDSFIRKALLNKSLPFLNTRISHYLKLIGLEHIVLFKEDMSVSITKFGTNYSVANLSSGQKARINLSLSFAFRDVLQTRFSKINLCVLDEFLDTGLGNVGVQLAAKMVKEIAKDDNLSMFVISHKDEVSSMFDDKLEIELRDGFSNIV